MDVTFIPGYNSPAFRNEGRKGSGCEEEGGKTSPKRVRERERSE